MLSESGRRVTVQWIEAVSDKRVWAENDGRWLDDVFPFQSEIALAGFISSFLTRAQRDACSVQLRNVDLCGSLCRNRHMATNLAIDPDLLERL